MLCIKCFTLQIQNAVRELADMDEDLSYDLFFLYCNENIPDEKDKDKLVSPWAIKNELEKEGFKRYDFLELCMCYLF